ncbi:unnamed protein product [Darwinula stevensoni]|uniref:G-protein coupled receptors family 2 profile 2 domain-containing protein n=1 Tax=Darwinula stevensoni TaxID=69355 RepID=A0A7R9AB03_9CRUS|nr:unnamed protein product [Darwinula stevensoni]CAG0898923.1 unnamed protein product [Darwinula stevensoni]
MRRYGYEKRSKTVRKEEKGSGFHIAIVQTQFAKRECSSGGTWLNSNGSESGRGWTDYRDCLPSPIKGLLDTVYSGDNPEGKFQIAQRTRVMENFGFSISLVSILSALVIFASFRSLRNERTRIHMNLFVGMLMQILVRLTIYMDQLVSKYDPSRRTLDNTEIVCQGLYILLEYGKTAMFMWMFLEGIHIHNMVVVKVFDGGSRRMTIYLLVGWGIPVLLTCVWATITGFYFTESSCWFSYNLTRYYWILEGPRLAFIIINLLFLLNITRVLVTKLRSSQSSETEQAR